MITIVTDIVRADDTGPGSTGHRIRELLGISAIDFTNMKNVVLSPSPWNASRARHIASGVVRGVRKGDLIVTVGSRCNQIFGGITPLASVSFHGGTFLGIPDLNSRAWLDPLTGTITRSILTKTIPAIRWGK